MRLVLLGPPGAGKGTQAVHIARAYGVPRVATGDIFRLNVSTGTPLGEQAKLYMDRGDLVPDDIVIGMVTDRLEQADASNGFLLDGFPRTVPQAAALEEGMSKQQRDLTAAILIEVPDEEVMRRLSGRRVSVKTGRVYHIEFDPPKHEGRCDVDGSRLVQRDDDKPET
nr:nucleoside monophosphate kinase [Chloroflexota bacterium]